MLTRTRRAAKARATAAPSRNRFDLESLESRTLLSATGSLAAAMFETNYASLILRPALKPAAAPRHSRPRATATSTITTSATGGLARVEQATPPTFLESLQVTTNADGTAAAEIDYQATEPGTYIATARWDNGPVESIVLDQPGEFWHEPTIGSLYPLRHGLASGQHTLEVTITNADRGVSATTSTAFSVDVVDTGSRTDTPVAGGDFFAPSDGMSADGGESLSGLEEDPAPQVAAVYVSGSTWSQDFKNYLQARLVGGSSVYGYAIPGGVDQLKTLPWTNVNTVSVVFSEDVTVRPTDLIVKGVNVADYGITGFVYDTGTFTATWTLDRNVANDNLLLHVTNFVVDGTGNRLDGEWTNASSPFPSGDTYPDGVFDFRVNVLPGDVNFDGAINDIDKTEVRNRFFRTTASPGDDTATPYTPFCDVDGNASIQAADWSATGTKVGTTTPSTEPSATSIAPPAAPSGLAAAALAPRHVELFWEDLSGNETGFQIERRSASGGIWSALDATAAGATRFADTTALPATSYVYRVSAVNAGGTSDGIESQAVTTQSEPQTGNPLSAPMLTAEAVTAGEVRLHWPDQGSTWVNIEVSNDEENFHPAGGGRSTANGVTTASVPVSRNDIDYTFRLRVDDGVGGWAYSNVATIRPFHVAENAGVDNDQADLSEYKMFDTLQTCPCCGYKTISDEYESCEICCWRYDEAQNKMPDFAGGANRVSLRQAQRNYVLFGAKDEEHRDWARPPSPEDERDPKWTPLPIRQ